ncbi:hypothetical protein [Lapillicoccus sp.]|uniref:hypothetical protein n=1 Tax=Lapillicoccus sp. TaxID=1909287 RepID=UPI0039837354
MQALATFAITWATSSGALALLAAYLPHTSTTADVLVVAVANVLSTAVRFLAMRRWIFHGAHARSMTD